MKPLNDNTYSIPGYMALRGENKAVFNLKLTSTPGCAKTSLPQDLAFNPVTQNELKPGSDDYVTFTFRAISARYLGPSGYFLDFSTQGVLESAVSRFLPLKNGGERRTWLKFHRNHSESISAPIGFISAARFEDAGGEQSAPGINVDVPIDWKLAPEECRKLMADPPLLDSVSISFAGTFEQSHKDLSSWDFWMLLGHEVDGEIVRVLVTAVDEVFHLALVTEGADEEADRIVEADDEDDTDSGEVDAGASLKNKLHLQQDEPKRGGERVSDFTLNPALLERLKAAFGLSEETPAAEDLVAKVEELKLERDRLQVDSDKFQKFLSDRRDGVKQLITKVEPALAETLGKAVDVMQFDELGAMETAYQAKLEAAFPAKCAECGSTKISRQSSQETPPEGGGEQQKKEKTVNQSDFES